MLISEGEIRKHLDGWLDTFWTNRMYDNFLHKRLDDTCDWVLSRPEFLRWQSPGPRQKSLLWVNGPPGYGKTILCARMTQHLSDTAKGPLAYFFFSSDLERRADPFVVVRSWISQIVRQSQKAFDLASERWEIADGHTASHSEIEEIFKAIVESIPDCIFIVDGLDECAVTDSDWKRDHRETLVGFLQTLRHAVIGETSRVLIVSRNTQEIREGLGAERCGLDPALEEIQIRPEDVRADATLFSRDIVDHKLANKNETQREQLSSRMVDRCESMFLGIKMLEGDLSGGKNLKQLQRIIDQTPNGLEHIYDRNWERITNLRESSRCRAFSILRWAAYGLRPITVLEITEALLLADEECDEPSYDELPDSIDDVYIRSEIIDLCGSLVETRGEESNPDLGSLTIHLTHFSVRQYILCHMLVSTGQLIMNERLRKMNEAVENNTLTKTCLRYLNSQQVWEAQAQEQEIDNRMTKAFRTYASNTWYRHARSNEICFEEVTTLVNAFFRPGNEKWELWRQDTDAASKDPMLGYEGDIKSGNPLFYASFLGFFETVKYLVDEVGLDVNYVDQSSRTALLAASATGWVAGVSYLLKRGADVSAVCNENKTAVYVAAHNGHVDVMKLLFEKGADLMAADVFKRTPLHVASGKGHAEAVDYLLQKGVDQKALDTVGLTPFYFASRQGQAQIVKRLLDMGADPMVTTEDGINPLYIASKNGHFEVVKLLLEYGADPNAAAYAGWTPLGVAVHYGYTNVAKLLLQNGSYPHTSPEDETGPFYMACIRGRFEITKLLLEWGADPATKFDGGCTPLQVAAWHGQREIVKLLLENGVDINLHDHTGYSPLDWASESGSVEAVKVLLECGADMMAPSKAGYTSLAYAICAGNTEVVKVLLDEGADCETPQEGYKLLWLACDGEHVETVKLLLERGAELTAMTDGFTALQRACRRGNSELVKLLLEKGADYKIASHGQLPLGVACYWGHTEVVRLLLEKGADPETRNEVGQTTLEVARGMGHQEVVKLLLEKEADLETLCDGWESLSLNSEERKAC